MIVNDASSIVRLQGFRPDKIAIKLLPEVIAREHSVVPLSLDDGDLVVACTDPLNRYALRKVEAACRRPVRAFRASYLEIQTALGEFYAAEPDRRIPLDLGMILFQLGYLPPQGLAKLQSLRASSTESDFQLCRSHELADDENLAEALGILCALPYLRLRGLNIRPDLSVLLSWEVATQRKLIPVWWITGTLVVATPELQPGDHLNDIAASLGVPVQPIICSYSDWERLYKRFYLRGHCDHRQQDLAVAQWLLKHGILSTLDLDSSLVAILQTEKSLEEIIVGNGLVTPAQWLQAQSEISGIAVAPEKYSRFKISANLQDIICQFPFPLAQRFLVVPLQIENSKLSIGISRPDIAIVQLISALTGLEVLPYLLAPNEIKRLLQHCYQCVPSYSPRRFPDLGQLLVSLGTITKTQLTEILMVQSTSEQTLAEKVVFEGYLDELSMIEILSLQTGTPRARLDHALFQPKSFSELPLFIIKNHLLLPVWSSTCDLWVATTDPLDGVGLREAQIASGKRIWPIVAPKSVLMAALQRLTGMEGDRELDCRVLDLLQELIGAGYLTQVGAANALKRLSQEDIPVDTAIANASIYSHREIAQAIANINKVPFVDLQLVEQVVSRIGPLGEDIQRPIVRDPVDGDVARLLSYQKAANLSALPIEHGRQGEVIVAFADPFYEQKWTEIETQVLHKVRPVMAYRRELEEAIQRNLGKRNIGSYLLLDGLISRSQLNDALEFARSTGVRLGQALVNRRYITEEQLYQYLSKQTSLPLYDLKTTQIDEHVARSIPQRTAREYGILPIQQNNGVVTVAVVDPFNTQVLETTRELLGGTVCTVLVTEKDLDWVLESLFSRDYLAQSISDLLERTPKDSAYQVLSLGQGISISLIVLLSVLWLWIGFTSYIIIINALSTIFYIAFSGYKLYLIYKALSHSMEVPVDTEEIQALQDCDLPVYTILIPVYKEAHVLPELLSALMKLDYPTTKLDIQVLMEEDDLETIDAFKKWNGPSHFHGLVVPFGQPKTKPKACNYGLLHARGDYLVIFDAEDIPEPDQLKKVVVAFSKSPARVSCIQSKLNYYNGEQNLLTRWFAVEYSMWFDLFLPGLSATNAPIPLGGTSNHFKRDVLIEIGAWDPYNVTEDADLGIRLFKRGYKTAIIDSTTFEEANSQIYNWMRQRSRWIKGYIQTWLVHMRDPSRLIREIGFKAFLSFHFVVGGTFFAALLNPIYWMLTTLWFLIEWQFIETIFPGIIYFLGAVALFIGNFAFTYMNVAGALRREQYSMVKYALMSPIYWAFASVAAWMGFIQLLYKPHFWEKTVHGLHKADSSTRESMQTTNGDS